ncbi:PKD repeat protein [Methanolinea mesophila]|uniref:PKD domain-containing protein n=1 Tax=Methanolinea mesophila TaxID=547055 RepID=UPI001AEA80F0|nr:PKD domain-containing protein [Methanolinea mesophila]MBP1928094.1 PKD repeat protein [Methanolinea mesophila]
MSRNTYGFIAFLAILLSCAVAPAMAAGSSSTPVLPHVFFGTVAVDGLPAPVGTEITAVVQGGGGSIVSDATGWYGYRSPFAQKLIVQGDIPSGAPITFYVNGEQAECIAEGTGGSWQGTYPFTPGEVTELDLRVGCAPPIADFTADPTSGDTPLTVQFNDASFGNPTAWSWTFGDGTSSTLRNPVHTYADAGNYVVSLNVTNDCGSDPITRTGFISAVSDPPPVADFTANTTSGTAPLTVGFTDTSLNLPAAWSWTFGDGSSSTLRNPVHTYAAPGNYTVSLEVSNGDGSDRITRTGFIAVDSNPPPVADFTANVTSGAVPLTIRFTDTSLNSPTAWSWTFGDGSSSTLRNPVHTYAAPGNYTVSLTASNSVGSVTVSRPGYIVVVQPLSDADFSVSPVSGIVPLTVYFTDLSGGHPLRWTYNFGDGFTSSSKNPRHTYLTPGNYTVTLTILKIEGGKLVKSTIEKQEVVKAGGGQDSGFIANFTAVPISGPAPLSVAFTDCSTGNPRFWKYDFGDGLTSTSRNPVHRYRAPGTYTVTLTITEIQGRSFLKNSTVMKDLITVGP